MFNSLNHKNLSRLAVAGTATFVSPATCWQGSIQHLISNSLMNQLTNLIVPLHLSRELYKSTLFMQNKANFKITSIYISACKIREYGNFYIFSRPKNKAKQSQFKPNFRPKLASFFPKLALNQKEIVALAQIPKKWCSPGMPVFNALKTFGFLMEAGQFEQMHGYFKEFAYFEAQTMLII